MDLVAFILQLTFIAAALETWAHGFVMPEEKKCQYSRVDKLLKIRCHDMNIKEVPQFLKSSVEVLDLSYNRIKKLKVSSFEKYHSIKYLLLYENMIQSIEPGTFERLTSLQEIDLSNNALTTIPTELLQLPSLRNLYIDSNELINLSSDLEALERPIRAPLEYLNVADCGLTDLPDLGVLPKLWHINASRNALSEINVSNFANMCSLRSIDLTRSALNDCTCQQVNHHFSYLGVDMKYVPVCKKVLEAQECPPLLNDTVLAERFQRCKTTPTKAEVRRFWYFIVGCIGGIALILLLVACCVHRIRRRSKRRSKARLSTQHSAKLVISPKNATNNHEHNDCLMRCDEV